MVKKNIFGNFIFEKVCRIFALQLRNNSNTKVRWRRSAARNGATLD